MSEKKRYTDYTEEELRDIQRREAIDGSEVYDDIDDSVYEDGPIAREYVTDEKIVKKARLESDDETHGTKPPEIVDGDPDEESSFDGTDRQEDAISPDEMYSACPETKRSKGFGVIPEKKRVYVDKDELIRSERNNKAKKLKAKAARSSPPMEEKTRNTIVSCVAIALSLVLAVLIFFGVAGFVTSNQRVDERKDAFLKASEAAANIVSAENAIFAEFARNTESFVLGTMDYSEYKALSEGLSADLKVQGEAARALPSSASYELNIKTATLDFISYSQTIIDEVIETFDEDSTKTKEYVLYYFSGMCNVREERYSNLTAVIIDEADDLNINATLDRYGIAFDVRY